MKTTKSYVEKARQERTARRVAQHKQAVVEIKRQVVGSCVRVDGKNYRSSALEVLEGQSVAVSFTQNDDGHIEGLLILGNLCNTLKN